MKQSEALEILKSGHNVYLTGAAGSGKTYLLNTYIDFLKSKGVKVGITASTGIAATHMNGVTIHSWSGLGIRDHLSNNDLDDLYKKSYLKKRFNTTNVLVIDEVSMLHPHRLDLFNQVAQYFKKNDQPFGGMQVVLCGDFFQLPPISRGSDKIQFVDKSSTWQNMSLKVCYLDEQHRHIDDRLTKVLNNIRSGQNVTMAREILNERYNKEILGVARPTKIYSHNIDVDRINAKELESLEGDSKTYNMYDKGPASLVGSLKKSCLAPEQLVLKKGASVMFVKNNFDIGYVNGTLGIVEKFDYDGLPVIKTYQGKTITAEPEDWRIEEDGKTKAAINQIPLRLAWAITIHKSQGMSLDAAEIDLSRSFERGMGYVALSRVRSLNGMRLIGINDLALKVNEEVLEADEELKQRSRETIEELDQLSTEQKAEQQAVFLKSILPQAKEKPISTYEKTKLLIDKKLSLKEMAEYRDMTQGTIISHLEKIVGQDKSIGKTQSKHIDFAYLKPDTESFDIIEEAFTQTGDTKLSPVKALLNDSFSYEELRLVRLFL